MATALFSQRAGNHGQAQELAIATDGHAEEMFGCAAGVGDGLPVVAQGGTPLRAVDDAAFIITAWAASTDFPRRTDNAQ